MINVISGIVYFRKIILESFVQHDFAYYGMVRYPPVIADGCTVFEVGDMLWIILGYKHVLIVGFVIFLLGLNT